MWVFFLEVGGFLRRGLMKIIRFLSINVRENRRDHQEWTIQRHGKHWAQNEDQQNKNKNTGR